MKNREIRKGVLEMLDALCDRSGFDDWWYNLDDEIEKEIEDELYEIMKKRFNKNLES
tara:strand:- start:3732 stop:3902 length:171 start_codon:yes stop_codon:yes gene_type:complete